MDKLVHCSSYLYHVQPVADLAEKIAHIAPGKNLTKTFFGNGGAEAIEGATETRTALHRQARIYFAVRQFPWSELGCAKRHRQLRSQEKKAARMPQVFLLPLRRMRTAPLWPSDPEECARQCARSIDEIVKICNVNDVAAFIAEPVMGEGGIVVPPFNYFKEVKKVLDHYGILFIATKCSPVLAAPAKCLPSNTTGVEPDILVSAKGIGGRISSERIHCEHGNRFRLQARRPSFDIWRQSYFVRGRSCQYRIYGKRKIFPRAPQKLATMQ